MTPNSTSFCISLFGTSCLRGWVHLEGTLWAGMSNVHLKRTPNALTTHTEGLAHPCHKTEHGAEEINGLVGKALATQT